ncbi:hypothetical protein PP175_26785 (plasmid) [Aneurinibacillus sp. Ricciae_BoGa-3]|uniref:hypothetical protein n=1 Tax=Aneurinibacillus sp. Ricciae_BoGa-3 TaxID=3022697 RepID=UPI00233FD898|nr:hypothetical protein [Aneurinibacillus sp. Ricciae_BoGa-3]WCK57645.1 hypothetical protein PP175_26785 [Aneurinibacillus sp. Ricciae_BoGa-3]
MRNINIEEVLTKSTENYMRSYLLQLMHITDDAVFNEIEANEDVGYQIRQIIEKAEKEILALGVGRGIYAPEIQQSRGYEAFYLWKWLKGEDTSSITDKQAMSVDKESVERLIKRLEKLIEE